MRQRLSKVAIFVWFCLTNIVSAAALEAAITYPFFRAQYILLAIIVWVVYLFFKYQRVKHEKARGLNESVIHYYFRTRFLKGVW
jgi:ABC-type branched-subunit amino acid transport system permease subunit